MKHYDGKGRLISIECDDCEALITPNPEIASSGWMVCGTVNIATFRNEGERHYCPKCWEKRL